jgi:hypothetical protein
MKSIVDYLKESVNEGKVTGISTASVKGSKTMKCSSKEYGVDINIKSSKWNKTTFIDEYDSPIVAYWTPDSEWIMYYYAESKKKTWAAVSEGTLNYKYTDSMFKEFEMLCMNGVTVPEFDTVDTNLE